MSNGWSMYVIALVAINVLGCVWLLWFTAKRRPGDPAPTDTSHVWDGDLTEYNKPLPRWWINLFYLTILFTVGYLAWYPGLGNFAGVSRWTSVKEMQADQKREQTKLDATFAPFRGQPIDALATNPTAVKLGKGIYDNNCATCHGGMAQGAIGYPNLTDSEWKWGGSPQHILDSIQKGREGVMAPWGEILRGSGGANAVDYVVAYVHSLSAPKGGSADFLAVQGKSLYDGVCVACHGPAGKGNIALGAPDLTDANWMYGGDNASIAQTIEHGRHGVMPAWLPTLGDDRTRLVGAYVWSLSHKPGERYVEPAAPAVAPAATPATAPAATTAPAADADTPPAQAPGGIDHAESGGTQAATAK